VNGAHDLGGMMGFGPINPEADEPVFHAGWEGRVLAMEIAIRPNAAWSLDAIRHTRESIPPPRYLSMSYYEIWLAAQEALLVRHGLIGPEELAGGRSTRPGDAQHVLKPAEVSAVVTRRGSYERAAAMPALFAVGDTVKTRNINPTGHTRLPRYARGRIGTIERVHGAHVFPDANAHGRGEDPRWCYSVRIDGPELWGAGTDPKLSVCLDLWEPYLERG
jgi:nitrile hydratase